MYTSIHFFMTSLFFKDLDTMKSFFITCILFFHPRSLPTSSRVKKIMVTTRAHFPLPCGIENHANNKTIKLKKLYIMYTSIPVFM